MVEFSNTVLVALVIAAFVVVAVGTVVNLNGGITGFATNVDLGNVTLTINSTLAIQVDPLNKTIDFGLCTPRGGSSYWCASNDAARCDGVVNNNCTADTGVSKYIRVYNVGNVDANVTFQSLCTAAQLIGGTGPQFQYLTNNCNGTAVASWASITGAVGQAACSNVSYKGGKMEFYVNVTIPQDAKPTGCANNASTITFTAVTSTG